MNSIKTIIVDDEPLAVGVLAGYAEQVPQIELLSTFSNAVDANIFLAENTVELIFLDVNMPVMDGFSFLETLLKKPSIIITTAHENYAIKGFEAEAIDYLVKPISFPRFLKAVNRIDRLLAETHKKSAIENTSIFVKVDNKKMQKIYLDEILVIESLKDYIHIKTHSKKYIVHKTLSGFTEELPEDKFIRIHRSYTVGIDKIHAIEGNSLEVAGVRYTIGRSYIETVKERVLRGVVHH